MSSYYQKHFGGKGFEPEIFDMYSGDVLDGVELIKSSPYRAQMRDGSGSLEHLIDEQYGEEIAALEQKVFVAEPEAEQLVDEIRRNVERRMALYPPDKLRALKFCVEVTDVAVRNFYQVAFVDGQPQVLRSDAADDDALLTIRLRSKILRHSLESDWGADVITIGYGAEIRISSKRAAEVNLEKVCMNLLSCYPTAKGALKKAPLRSLKFAFSNPPKYTRSLKKLRQLSVASENYNREVWLLKTAADIRKIYDLPELDAEFIS
jgi:hypothetical protein